MAKDFKISWQADDGYCGASRPQSLTISTSDFEGEETLEEIVEQIEDQIQSDFEQKVHWTCSEYKSVAEKIFAALQAEIGEADAD